LANVEIESVKHIVISRSIIMVDISARRDGFSICLWKVSLGSAGVEVIELEAG